MENLVGIHLIWDVFGFRRVPALKITQTVPGLRPETLVDGFKGCVQLKLHPSTAPITFIHYLQTQTTASPLKPAPISLQWCFCSDGIVK